VITSEERVALLNARTARDLAVQVDAFDRGHPPVTTDSPAPTSRPDNDTSSYTFGEPGPGPLL
jgi:hypothetical protein